MISHFFGFSCIFKKIFIFLIIIFVFFNIFFIKKINEK